MGLGDIGFVWALPIERLRMTFGTIIWLGS